MASNLDTLITVFGGSGFLGRNVVRALAKRDYRIRIAVRRPDAVGHREFTGHDVLKELITLVDDLHGHGVAVCSRDPRQP